MTAFNINIEQFIGILKNLSERGIQLINLDMVPDENNPQMNKLIIHPNENLVDQKPLFKSGTENQDPIDIKIKDPDMNKDDIFDLFNKAL